MSAFVQSAFTTGGSTFVRARPQTRRAPATRVSALSASPSHTSHARPIDCTDAHQPSDRRLQASGRVSLRVQAIAEGRQSLFVAVTVKSGKMEEYEKLIKRHSESVNQSHRSFVSPVKPDKRASLTIPPSDAVTNCYMNDRCMYFDFGVNQDGSDPNVVYLYEVYEDEAALQEHRDSSHLKEYLSAAAELTDSHDVRTLNLAPYGSVNCNYAGQCEIGEGMWD